MVTRARSVRGETVGCLPLFRRVVRLEWAWLSTDDRPPRFDACVRDRNHSAPFDRVVFEFLAVELDDTLFFGERT